MDERDNIQEVKERLIRIETLLDQMVKTDALERKLLEEKIKVANNRIADLEKNNTWLWKTIVGSIIAGAFALLFE